jgi:regulator of replication initiation timing
MSDLIIVLNKRIEELEAENDELDRIAVTMCRQKNELEAENERLREALKYIAFTTPGPTMKTHSEAAEQALKEASDDDFKDKKEAR